MPANDSITATNLTPDKPYWNYEDIGVFFLILVLIGSLLRLLVRFDLLPRSELNNPSLPFECVLISSLTLTLYLVLKLRHHCPVLRPLGWVWPRSGYAVVAVTSGTFLAWGVVLYLRFENQNTTHIRLEELLILAFLLGPLLEESFFRGCLLPLMAETTNNLIAIIFTGLLFALFHQPADLPHWISFTATGLAYGWIRVASGSTGAAALMHATYNLVVFLSAMF